MTASLFQRHAYQQLLRWKNHRKRKPLIMQGARQVGKTHLLKTFGNKEYESIVYLNFEEDEDLINIFEQTRNQADLLSNIQVHINRKIRPENDLLVLDEIQQCSAAISYLKYLNEDHSDLHCIAAGSLLGVKLASEKSFPVGKVDLLHLAPITFVQFLTALKLDELRNYIDNINEFTPLPEPFHIKLCDLLKKYIYIGGMPEAIDSYIESEDYEEVRRVQNNIINTYLLDFAKHAPPHEIIRLNQIWNSIPKQLAKENKKFIFTAVEKSARAREYEIALEWLVNAALIHKTYHLTAPKLPLTGYGDTNAFKVYLLDVGLLGALAHIQPQYLLKPTHLFAEYNGAFTENFVAQELHAHLLQHLYYWASENRAEVDFIVSYDREIIPLEVKANVSTKKRSLRVYQDKFHPKYCARSSLLNLKKDGTICNFPLYLLHKFPQLIFHDE